MLIKEVSAKIIKDSRGEDTIAVSVNNCKEASSPNGKSTGEYETTSYHQSLNWCVDFLNAWCDEIIINKFEDLARVEKAVCKNVGVKNAREFGANSLYAFESAILKALAHEQGKDLWQIISPNVKKLPYPVGNVIGGGLHSAGVKDRPNFQEFLVIPKAKKFADNLKVMQYVYTECDEKTRAKLVNDEGAWLVSTDDENALRILDTVRRNAEKKFKLTVGIGLDIAASTLYKDNHYRYNTHSHNSQSQKHYISKLISEYNLIYAEDPLEQKDFKGFAELNKTKGKKCLIVGDDLIATQYNRLVGAIRTRSINAVIIKPNQNGSLLELKKIFELCKKNKIKTIMSHRSGETLDSALADYAVGFGADYIKCGVATKWREAKLNRLKEIESKLK
ncbi:MAG: hypothetical protein ACP5NS_04375 [Candidatus Pacearchaeota archaeon]